MVAVEARPTIPPIFARHWLLWLGLAALAVPAVITLGQQVWSTELGAHGPVILITGLWILWRQMDDIRADARPGAPWLTALMFIPSLAVGVFGHAYDFISLEVAGLYGVCLACLHAYVGLRPLLRNWFPLFYLACLIPPPGWLMDSLTRPLKEFVSYAATSILQALGVPIIRMGVTMMVDQYQLLVEDACSGMNSLIGLIAISLFYIYLLRNASWRYSALLAALVIPIAIIANIIRIMVLVLLTYFFGDGVAQSFLHMAAGLFLFSVSLLLVFSIDHLISSVSFGRRLKYDRTA